MWMCVRVYGRMYECMTAECVRSREGLAGLGWLKRLKRVKRQLTRTLEPDHSTLRTTYHFSHVGVFRGL